jgi:hypothetical protein
VNEFSNTLLGPLYREAVRDRSILRKAFQTVCEDFDLDARAFLEEAESLLVDMGIIDGPEK